MPHDYQLEICADGYRTLTSEERAEHSATSTTMPTVTSSTSVDRPTTIYGGPRIIDALAHGTTTIGDGDPAQDCDYCIIAADDPTRFYQESPVAECRAERGPLSFEVPATALIGGLDRRRLRDCLRERSVRLNRAADALFDDDRFLTSPVKSLLPIVCLSVDELGFAEGCSYEQLVESAGALGLRECPLELGPYLRLAWREQPELPDLPNAPRGAPPGAITIASRPLDRAEGTPNGFYLRKVAGELWLRGYWAPATHVWGPRDRFVFARR